MVERLHGHSQPRLNLLISQRGRVLVREPVHVIHVIVLLRVIKDEVVGEGRGLRDVQREADGADQVLNIDAIGEVPRVNDDWVEDAPARHGHGATALRAKQSGCLKRTLISKGLFHKAVG